ncbi:MAG: hypothetical protein K2X03_10515 [Bryobacteraceae bacterium]|nr:hypothetical protein [Bryobacteraceae bacterium]
MSIGAIKQLAAEALGNQVKEVIEGRRASEPTAAEPESLSALVMAQVQAMQNALKDDQELLVTCSVGATTLRVLELYAPSAKLLVITGAEGDRGIARIISPVEAVQLICRPVAVKPEAKPTRVRLVTGKSK